MQRNYEFQDKGSEAMLWLGMDRLNSLRGTIDGNLIGQGRAHVLNDIWAGRMNSRIWLRIASIRNKLNQRTQNDNDKECQYDYETYGINHNASKQEFQEQQAPEDFRKIEWYFEHFCEILESTGDERILGKCENYP